MGADRCAKCGAEIKGTTIIQDGKKYCCSWLSHHQWHRGVLGVTGPAIVLAANVFVLRRVVDGQAAVYRPSLHGRGIPMGSRFTRQPLLCAGFLCDAAETVMRIEAQGGTSFKPEEKGSANEPEI